MYGAIDKRTKNVLTYSNRDDATFCHRRDIVDISGKSEGTILAAILIGTAITLRQTDRDQTALRRIVPNVTFEGNIATTIDNH